MPALRSQFVIKRSITAAALLATAGCSSVINGNGNAPPATAARLPSSAGFPTPSQSGPPPGLALAVAQRTYLAAVAPLNRDLSHLAGLAQLNDNSDITPYVQTCAAIVVDESDFINVLRGSAWPAAARGPALALAEVSQEDATGYSSCSTATTPNDVAYALDYEIPVVTAQARAMRNALHLPPP